MTRYMPDTHDVIVTAYHGRGLDNYEILDRLAQIHDLYIQLSKLKTHMKRMGLAANPRATPAAINKMRDENRTPRGKPDPYAVAEIHLPGFRRETMTLNGTPIKLHELMPRVNAALAAQGLPQILTNPSWEARKSDKP